MCLFILRTFAGSRKVVLEIQIGGSNLQKNKNFLNETTDFYVTLYVKLHWTWCRFVHTISKCLVVPLVADTGWFYKQ